MKKLYQDFMNAKVVFLFSMLAGLIIGLTIIGRYGISIEEIVELENINNLVNEQNRILKDEMIDLMIEFSYSSK